MNSIPAMAAVAFGIVVLISLALTLTVEGAGALWLRQQVRLFLKRPSTAIAAQQPAMTEGASEIVIR